MTRPTAPDAGPIDLCQGEIDLSDQMASGSGPIAHPVPFTSADALASCLIGSLEECR